VPTWASRPYKGLPDADPKGERAPGATRTHTGQPLRLVPLPLGYESVEPLARLERAAFPLRGGRSAR
jgi:hypothetical protein